MDNTQEEIIRVLRIIEYVGQREWVERTINNSITGTRNFGLTMKISAATIGSFPEIMKGEDKND